MGVRIRGFILIVACALLAAGAVAQSNETDGPITRVPVDRSAPAPKDNRKGPPRSDQLAPDESSSKQTQIDVSPPAYEKKDAAAESDIDEFHPWDPHKAAKCIEVGDYYFKQGNYRGAISRYQEALEWKPNDAEATYKLGVVQEKSGNPKDALGSYCAYLKILPSGTYATKAQQAINRIKPAGCSASSSAPVNPS